MSKVSLRAALIAGAAIAAILASSVALIAPHIDPALAQDSQAPAPEGQAPADLIAKGFDEFGRPRLGGIGQVVADELERRLNIETRVTVLGYVQRGGTPTAYDRVLATRFGWHAAQLVQRGEFGRMVALQGGECTSVPIAEVAGRRRTVPLDHPLLRTARSLGVVLGD